MSLDNPVWHIVVRMRRSKMKTAIFAAFAAAMVAASGQAFAEGNKSEEEEEEEERVDEWGCKHGYHEAWDYKLSRNVTKCVDYLYDS